MSLRSTLVIGSLVTLVAGCTANVESPEEHSTASSASMLRCGPGQAASCDGEGPRGTMVCWCEDIASDLTTGTNSAACTGTIAVPAALTGMGCTVGTWINLSPEGAVPIWKCNSTATFPQTVGVVAGGTLPSCPWVDGEPQPLNTSNPFDECAAIYTSPYLSDSCWTDAPTGKTYVVERVLARRWSIGTNCGGGCSKFGTGGP
jgi:hypothetical protein